MGTVPPAPSASPSESGGGVLKVPWSSSSASPDGVWRSCGRGLGCGAAVVVVVVVFGAAVEGEEDEEEEMIGLRWRVTEFDEGVAMVMEILCGQLSGAARAGLLPRATTLNADVMSCSSLVSESLSFPSLCKFKAVHEMTE